MAPSTIVWFRQDLRVADNPALSTASRSPIIALFVAEETPPSTIGGARRWWLHHSLMTIEKSLARQGVPLVLRRGNPEKILAELISETGASAVHWNRCHEPAAIMRDAAIKSMLEKQGIAVRSFNANLLFEPWEVKSAAGAPFKVFSHFWRACLQRRDPHRPLPEPALRPHSGTLPSLAIQDLELLPREPDWTSGLRAEWEPGEAGAARRLQAFLGQAIKTYADDRDYPARPGTSLLSPHLTHGEISPRTIWHAIRTREIAKRVHARHADKFLAELGWREFSHHVLFHTPTLAERALRAEFEHFPWQDDKEAFKAWCKGKTGYPIVDAGMRQLWQTGWMHNRVRMIAASFLTKDLLIDWRKGAAWFWDTLVDADLANNTASWQWVAGCGADAAPFFRIFNPVLQGTTFDPEGAYVRRFVPELAGLPAQFIHQPWMAPQELLARARIVLGETYPNPLIQHDAARRRALAAFESIKGLKAKAGPDASVPE
ncbi:MAG: deoxyribodipyrimidine photo-lyase [Alphaproteobacteria bacterium]|nr:deoxyribodipyrimidine photo-lyase [Alphaproteobacteria bacterium]